MVKFFLMHITHTPNKIAPEIVLHIYSLHITIPHISCTSIS